MDFFQDKYRQYKFTSKHQQLKNNATWWLVCGALIVSSLAMICLVLSCLIEYPDVMTGNVTIENGKLPVNVSSNGSGRLCLLANNNTNVKQDDAIAYIKTDANYNDVRRLDGVLTTELHPGTVLNMPQNLKVGELKLSYDKLSKSYKKYNALRHCSKTNAKRTGAVKSEPRSSFFESNISMGPSNVARYAGSTYDKENVSEINVDASEELREAYAELQNNLDKFKEDVQRWEARYVITAPVSGKLKYSETIQNGIHINSNEELFNVLPNEEKSLGVAYVTTKAGLLKKDLKAHITFGESFTHDYGYIRGRVNTISQVSVKRGANNEKLYTYKVLLNLPNGLVSNYGHHLNFACAAKGQVEIHTKSRRIIMRMFDNLKSNLMNK